MADEDSFWTSYAKGRLGWNGGFPSNLGEFYGMMAADKERKDAAAKGTSGIDIDRSNEGVGWLMILAGWIVYEIGKMAWTVRDEFGAAAFVGCASLGVINKLASDFKWGKKYKNVWNTLAAVGAICAAIYVWTLGLPAGTITSKFFNHFEEIFVGMVLMGILYLYARDAIQDKLDWETGAKALTGIALIGALVGFLEPTVMGTCVVSGVYAGWQDMKKEAVDWKTAIKFFAPILIGIALLFGIEYASSSRNQMIELNDPVPTSQISLANKTIENHSHCGHRSFLLLYRLFALPIIY
jgi:uncharacterized membrane protein YfcA